MKKQWENISKDGLIPIVVTTSHRGVFFGWGKPDLPADGRITLRDAQMCVTWPIEQHSVLGLAERGPLRTARVGPPVSVLYLNNVDAVMEASQEAVEAWKKEPWT